MLFTKEKIENQIINELSNGSYPSPELVENISNKLKVTPQGIYKSISFLIKEEVITKNKMILSLNNLWIEKLRNFTDRTSKKYSVEDFNDYLLLQDKEKMSYYFKDALRLDNQWLHFVLVLLKRFPNAPAFIWNPHHWFIFARPDTESLLFDWLNKNKRPSFLLIGSNHNLDKIAQKTIKSENIRASLNPEIKLPKDKYIIIVGEYILHTQYSNSFIETLEHFYKNNNSDSEKIQKKFSEILKTPQKAKIIFERNKEKSNSLIRKISKDFYIPEDTRNF